MLVLRISLPLLLVLSAVNDGRHQRKPKAELKLRICMIKKDKEQGRANNLVTLQGDLVITGGGMAGSCAAITAARAGIKVILVQDRPVLGGNASSEVRLWILGATSHMGNNNRWAREGGVIDEILTENLFRNKEGNPLILDTILLEKVTNEPNITLLLNTAVYGVEKHSERSIKAVNAFCSQNSTEYLLSGTFFCDASGDGILSFLAGASFRMGAESGNEYGEGLAPEKEYGGLLGHSIYFYSKRTENPVKFVPPAFALKDIKKIPRYKKLNPHDDGCRLWWIEYGGRHDTVHDTELIKWELWRIVYGVWDFIKNSGEFEDVEKLTLEWVGTIPGKRESRRFEGLYVLTQSDVIHQTFFEDAVSYGGWALDLHPADGIYSDLPGCNQWHSKGIYHIPYRCFVSKDIDNLFFAGRIISTTHVAFGSSRVMATCASGAQAVAMAAAMCTEYNLLPRDIMQGPWMLQLQDRLNRTGQGIPGLPISYAKSSLTDQVQIKASSVCRVDKIPFDGPWQPLNIGAAQLLPFAKDVCYTFKVKVRAARDTVLKTELRVSSKKYNYTPETTIGMREYPVVAGEQLITIEFPEGTPHDQYGFLIFHRNTEIALQMSQARYTGILSVFNGKNKAVSNNGFQDAPEHSGVESFEFWCPRRRPEGQNIAMEISPALKPYDAAFLKNGFTHPYLRSNAWAADLSDKIPTVELTWQEPQKISSITLFFDTDFDHPMESSLLGHPENVMPCCVKEYRIIDDKDQVIYTKTDNHQTINRIHFAEFVCASGLKIQCKHPDAHIPAALFEIIIA